jgi:AcrR family transcriptional regulator
VTTRRLAKDDRRKQLLDCAARIVREQGTDALTLPHLAERAKVTRPVVYEHFSTRQELLTALYRHYDEPQIAAVRVALAGGAATLDDVVRVLSAAYIDCSLGSGPEFGAIMAALSATEEMETFRLAVRKEYIAQYRAAMHPFLKLPPGKAHAVFTGVLGAAEALAQEAAASRLRRDQAVEALIRIFRGALNDS